MRSYRNFPHEALKKMQTEIDKNKIEELSYEDYQSGNYDPEKPYAIPDYPVGQDKAEDIFFDDTEAKTGSDNVQGAIDKHANDISSIKEDIEYLEDETTYCGEGDSYMGVVDGNIGKITIPENESREITLTTKEAVRSHDKALEKVAQAITPYKGSATVSKGGGTYSFPKPLEGDLKSVLGNGIFLVTVYSSNTAWRYVGLLNIAQIGTTMLTPLMEAAALEVSVDTTNNKLVFTNVNTGYDMTLYVTITKIGGA